MKKEFRAKGRNFWNLIEDLDASYTTKRLSIVPGGPKSTYHCEYFIIPKNNIGVLGGAEVITQIREKSYMTYEISYVKEEYDDFSDIWVRKDIKREELIIRQ